MSRIRSWWNWIGTHADHRWAVVGKGPTFAERDQVDWSSWYTLGLNHVIREMDVDVAHAIDLEVIDQVPLDRWLSADLVVMPWRPHVQSRTSRRTLAGHVDRSPTLDRLCRAGRLATYNLAVGRQSPEPLPRWGRPVSARYYSAEAAFNLLGSAGVRDIGTLGIDGGVSYAPAFDDLRPFGNGRRSFDEGIDELRTISIERGLRICRLSGAPW